MTAVGAHGRTGVPALGRVQREPRRGPGSVMTPHHSMEALIVQTLPRGPRRSKVVQKVVPSSLSEGTEKALATCMLLTVMVFMVPYVTIIGVTQMLL